MLYFRSLENITHIIQFSKNYSERYNLSKLSKTFSILARYGYILHRKEVIHPHLPVGIPCYDLSPVTDPTFDVSLPLLG